MRSGIEKFQIVIAAYGDGRSFWRTVACLMESGFELDQIEFAAIPSVLAELPLSRGVQQSTLSVSEKSDGGVEVPTRCARIIDTHTRADTAPTADNSNGIARLARSVEEFERLARDGEIVLAVLPLNPEQRRSATRILLQLSSEKVQTQNFNVERRNPPTTAVAWQ